LLTLRLPRCRPTALQATPPPPPLKFSLFLRCTHTTLAKIQLITITCAVITPEYGTLHGTPDVNRISTRSLLHCDERITRKNIPVPWDYDPLDTGNASQINATRANRDRQKVFKQNTEMYCIVNFTLILRDTIWSI
jgi:hypothetical protein